MVKVIGGGVTPPGFQLPLCAICSANLRMQTGVPFFSYHMHPLGGMMARTVVQQRVLKSQEEMSRQAITPCSVCTEVN